MKKAIIGSLVLSILHSILFFDQDFGISVVLFAIPSVFALMAMLKKCDKVKNEKAFYLAIPIILLSSTYFIFNNEFFNVVNILVIPLLLGIMIVWATTDVFKLKTMFTKSISLVIGSLEFIPNSIKLIKSVITFKTKEGSKNEKAKLIGIGILCSIPILLIILALLISADGIFASFFGKIADQIMALFTSETLIMLILRVILIIIVFIYLVCIIYNIINKGTSYNSEETEGFKSNININTIIVNTILTIVNIIYLLFSVVQFIYVFSYLFGITEFADKYNLATYARQGFFQLMLVSFINFAIIIITNFNKNEANEKTRKYTKIMNLAMAIFTLIIAISAFMRMNLYEREFGYTFLRLMVYVILLTEIIMIIPTILYILKRKINLFKSYFIIAITMYVIVNFINIDSIIAGKNISRQLNNENSKRELDVKYLIRNTGTDAIPELVKLYNETEDKTNLRMLNNYLYNTYEDLKGEDRTWQEFNISKHRAQKLLEGMNLKNMQDKIKPSLYTNNI